MADYNYAYGAGLLNGWIKTADGDQFDIEAIINIETDINQDDTVVNGDDTVKATFSANRTEGLKITANAISMDTIQAITGNSVSSSADGNSIALGTDSEMSAPFVEVGGQVTAKTKGGKKALVQKVWHKVQLNTTNVSAGNGNELSVEWDGTAYQTSEDITGVALNSKRIATLSTLNNEDQE